VMGDGLDNHGKDYDQPLGSGDVDGDCGQQVSSGGDIYSIIMIHTILSVRWEWIKYRNLIR
jgi:hypothetical protein